MFTIITVNFNNKEGLERSINSFISQDYVEKELIIVDGGSTDGSLEVIKEYNQHIDQIVVDEDEGIYDAMNIGLGLASDHSTFIHFLNSGDVFCNQNVLNKVYKSALQFNGHIYGDVKRNGVIIGSAPTINYRTMSGDMICHQAIFFNTKIHKQVLYDTSYSICADYKMILEFIKSSVPFKKIELVICTIELGGISSVRRKKLHEEKNSIRKKYPKLLFYTYLKRMKRLITV
ncbi:MAG: glycosyltransferase [Bacteroidia bacterium]